MSDIRRYYASGQVYFITSVTANRVPILVEYAPHLLEALTSVSKDMGIEVPAWIIVADHFHCIVDPKDKDVATFMKRVKLKFAYRYRQANGLYRGKVWQQRFWDHIIRDQDDLNKHIDYIHYHPIKHGLALRPEDWPWTSMKEWIEKGLYEPGWGVNEELEFEGEFGE